MSRRNSASALGGIGSPSGVCKPSRRVVALFSLGLKPRIAASLSCEAPSFRPLTASGNAEPNQRCLHSVDDPTSLSDEAVMLAVGPLGILVLHRRDLDHLAVITLAAQPAEKGAFEQLGVETVSLGAPMLARHRHTRCVNDVGLDAARLEPARQPEAVTASLEGDCDALDPASCFLCFLSPSM